MDCGEVVLGDAMIFPGLPGIGRYSYKGVDQEVPAIPTSIGEHREQLPFPVHLRRREHLIHHQGDGVIIDADGR